MVDTCLTIGHTSRNTNPQLWKIPFANHLPCLPEKQVGQLPVDLLHFLGSLRLIPFAKPQVPIARRTSTQLQKIPLVQTQVLRSGRPGQLPACRTTPFSKCPINPIPSSLSPLLYCVPAPNTGRNSLLSKRPRSPPQVPAPTWVKTPAQPQATKARRPERKKKSRNKTPIQLRKTQKLAPRNIINSQK